MKTTQCVPEKISKFMIGSLMLAAAAGLVVIGMTLLPVFGFMLAVPVIALSVYMFRRHLNKECQIDPGSE